MLRARAQKHTCNNTETHLHIMVFYTHTLPHLSLSRRSPSKHRVHEQQCSPEPITDLSLSEQQCSQLSGCGVRSTSTTISYHSHSTVLDPHGTLSHLKHLQSRVLRYVCAISMINIHIEGYVVIYPHWRVYLIYIQIQGYSIYLSYVHQWRVCHMSCTHTVASGHWENRNIRVFHFNE
jgi:hypothetical protein